MARNTVTGGPAWMQPGPDSGASIAAQLIRRHEAMVLVCYDDATGKRVGPGYKMKGHPTIGYGRALDVRGITEPEANYFLERDLITAERDARTFMGSHWESLSPARQAVLIDMAHNLGFTGLSAFRRLYLALMAGDWDAAAEEMLDSLWAQQVGKRAERLARIMRAGQWDGD